MITQRRALVALVALTVALAISLVNGVSHGWSAIAVFGSVCLAVAIAAEFIVIRRSRAH